MMKHTAGPWNAHYAPAESMSDGREGYVITREGYGGCFAVVRGALGRSDEANARLIAAAPDMYEALERIVEVGRFTHNTRNYAADIARAALAKAEGR